MRVLVVGLGGIGQRHVRNLRRLYGDAIEILTCRTRGLSRVLTDDLEIGTGDVEATYGINACDSLATALSRQPDAVFVCNPTSLHVPTARAAAEAGCHLFVEKPLSHSWDGVDALIATVERQQVTAMVGYQLRFHPCLRRLRALLAEGALGRLLTVRAEVAEYLPGWHRYEDYRQMYAARRDLGGGVILSQIHELDYLCWLFGSPRRVFALGGQSSTLDIEVEDTATMLLEYEVEGRPLPVYLHQDYVQRPPSRTCDVIGEAARARLDFHARTLEVTDTAGRTVEAFRVGGFERNQPFLDEMIHFVGCLRGEATPLVTLRDGSASLRVALAAHESIETRQVVTL